MKFTEIGDFDMLPQTGFKLLNETQIGGSDGAIINMHRDDCDFIFVLV